MKKQWELTITENGKVTHSELSEDWGVVEATLIFLQEDLKNPGSCVIEELFDGQREEVLRVDNLEHIPVNLATEFHLILRKEYKMAQKAIDELLQELHLTQEYTELQDAYERAEKLLRDFEYMVPHGLKRI